MKSRLETFIASCTDPMASQVRYHKSCWMKYVCGGSQKKQEDYHVDENQAKEIFLNHVRNIIFEENEPRTLKGLLQDFNQILDDNDCEKCQRTSIVKEMLENEFGNRIGFHMRSQVNQSWIVFDVSKGGNFIEAALNSWGISDDDLLYNLAQRMRKKSKSSRNFKWPPKSSDLEYPAKIPEDIVKFLTWLRNPNLNANFSSDDPKVLSIGDLLNGYISNERTHFQV